MNTIKLYFIFVFLYCILVGAEDIIKNSSEQIEDSCESKRDCKTKSLYCGGDVDYTYSYNYQTCVKLPVDSGSKCINELCGAGLKCSFYDSQTEFGQVCSEIQYLSVGENCTENLQCLTGVCDFELGGVCTGNDLKKCDQHIECPPDKYCDIGESGKCLPLSKLNQYCSDKVLCDDLHFCDHSSNTCKKIFTLNLNQTCHSNHECNWSLGLICLNSTCKQSNITVTHCKYDHECEASVEICDCGVCKPIQNYTERCSNLTKAYYQCAMDNGCSVNMEYYPVHSCVMRYCPIEYCHFTNECNVKDCTNGASDFMCGSSLAFNETFDGNSMDEFQVSNGFQLYIAFYYLIFIVCLQINLI